MKDEASVMEEPKQETTKMELIEDENLRLLTLKKRKEELKQELHQLTTLCDIPACMIIHDPATNSTSIWPEDSAQVRGLIDSYKADPSAVRAYGVSDFISERQKNVDEKVVKLRKTNAESKYPSRGRSPRPHVRVPVAGIERLVARRVPGRAVEDRVLETGGGGHCDDEERQQ